MLKKRIIARIDVKNEFVIKGIHLEGLRKVGDPHELAVRYYEGGIDEIIFMDAVASLYGRNNLFHIIEQACRDVFVPITVGGGIRSLTDIEKALKSGADKVALNTQAVKTPQLVSDAARIFGSQCIVSSIEAKRAGNSWEAYIDNGREHTGIDAIQWARQLQELGAGELLITSVDREGTKSGFDNDLLSRVCDQIIVPVIASGGAGVHTHVVTMFDSSQSDAVALASLLHYNLTTVKVLKADLAENGVPVRL
ncbi:MAG: imidazole glycerol phosphate synthase subunit HisF [Geobacteraceae bacterium GWB2_52_12]|nr:MAG: imidazole glycerol phosphate synthase subunit HisF [Geobacteraceae bacterium GWB2_52_12]